MTKSKKRASIQLLFFFFIIPLNRPGWFTANGLSFNLLPIEIIVLCLASNDIVHFKIITTVTIDCTCTDCHSQPNLKACTYRENHIFIRNKLLALVDNNKNDYSAFSVPRPTISTKHGLWRRIGSRKMYI